MLAPFLAITLIATPCSEVTDQEANARLDAVSAAFDAAEPGLSNWVNGVVPFHGAIALGATLWFNQTEDEGRRESLAFAIVGSGLGMLTAALFRPPALEGRAAIDRIRGKEKLTLQQKLRRAEEKYAESARKVRFARSWLSHLSSGLYGIGTSLALWLGYGEPGKAATYFAGSLLIGQGRILLLPRTLQRAWQAYLNEFPDAGCVDDSWEVGDDGESVADALFVAPAPGGAALGFRF